MLRYRIEAGPVVHLEEPGARKRQLYAETLREIAESSDREVLSLLMSLKRQGALHVDTLAYNAISIPAKKVAEVMRLLALTGKCGFAWGGKARVVWRAEEVEGQVEVEGRLVPGGSLAEASLILPGAVVVGGCVWLVEEEVFAGKQVRGRRFLEGREVEWCVRRRMALGDPYGCTVRLIAGDARDLLDAGYVRRGMEFAIGSERAVEAVALLMGVGWEVVDLRGRKVVGESARQVRVGARGVEGWVRFGDREVGLERAVRGLVELGGEVVGWMERRVPKPGKVAAWELEKLLEVPGIEWDAEILRGAKRLAGQGIPEALPGAEFRGKLLPYQQKGVDWLWFLYEGGYGALLADEMGLGKTVQTAAFFSRLPPRARVLVVAPTSLLCNWEKELRRFLGERRVKVLSYAQLRLEGGTLGEWDVVVLDEAQVIKNQGTQVATAARELRAQFRISLTGTPIENRAEELASQFAFLMPGYLEGRGLVREQVKPFILRRKKSEVGLELPPKREQVIWLEMGPKQRTLYEEIKRGVRPIVEEGHPMQVLEALLRLRQVCVDPRLVDPGAEMGVKGEQLAVDLEGEGKWLIFSQFTKALRLFKEEGALYLDGEMSGEARAEVVERFQEGENRHFWLSLKAGGVGLNLTAADRVLLLDPWWNEAVEQQAIDRAHRIGQTRPLHVLRYLIAGSIEERMHELKAKKRGISDAFLGEPLASFTLEDWRYLLE